MSFVLDTDICSAHLRGEAKPFNKFLQYSGGLYVSTVTIAELFTWVDKKSQSPKKRQTLLDLLRDLKVLSFDFALAEYSGNLRASMLDAGLIVPFTDFLIGCTALYNNFTMVTHNVKHYQLIPGLRIQDWRE